MRQLLGYWESLDPKSEAKARLAPPPGGTLNWIPPAVCAVIAVLLLANGAVLFGLLALTAAGVVGFSAHHSYSSAQARLEAWRQALFCLKCEHDFPPKAALTV